ncbi:MAG: diguanylate cyclase [Oscillospiraceae bacterium]|nr:diguanylate cyclase [Oscillospiraceae bacterium]
MNNAKLKVVLTAILLVFAIVPSVIAGVVGTFSVMGYETAAKEDTLEVVSRSKSVALDQLFTHYTGMVNTAAKSELVIRAADSKDGGADALLESMTKADTDIIDALIINLNGDIVASAKGNESVKFGHFDADGLLPVSGILNWQSYDGASAFYVSKEIYDDADAKTGKLGYMCTVISVGADSAVVKALGGTFLEGGHIVLFDNAGNTINFNADGALLTSSQVDGSFAGKMAEMRSNTNNVSTTSSVQIHDTGRAGKYAYVCGIIPNITTWRWAGIVDAGTFSSFSMMSNIIGWGVILVACAIASLIAVTIVNKFIGNMHEMINTMDAISEEENGSDIRFTIKNRKSEIGRIKSSFNEMMDEVLLSEERHRTIAELSDNMLFEWDFHKERMFVSANALSKFDIDTENATLSNGKFIDSLMSGEDAERYKRDINQLLRDKNGYSAEYQLKAKSGAVIWVSLRASVVTERMDEPMRVIGVMTDIDNEKKMELQLSERASYDFLSQLYNRNTFTRTLTQELERRNNKKLALLFIDVDDFKFINDRYGHTIGDEVIKYVADTIRTKVDDKGGFAGRFGGDEFVLCFTDQEDIENIENISMDIINELYGGHTTSEGNMTINVKASIGIALCPEHSEDVNELLAFSDTAMYFVKKNGKTNYHVYTPEDSENEEYIDPEF